MEEITSTEIDISNLIQNVVLHACMALSPVGIKLPGSGTHRIEQFCADILSSIQSSGNRDSSKKKKKSTLPEQSLLPEVEIHNFYEGAKDYQGFAEVICQRLARYYTNADPDTNPVLKNLCWEIYSEYQKSDITYPKWLDDDSTYNLWLIFCSISSPLSKFADLEAVKDALIRVFQLSGYSWNEGSESIIPTNPIDFPMMLECLTKCFNTLNLHPGVVTETVVDLKDEIVCGVLKKGYLRKKGHKAPTIKRRWFVLTRNLLSYYKSRDKMDLKGQIVLNPSTTTEVLTDKADKKHRFQLICGQTNVKYELYADDNKSRNEWILDIGKAIQLENAFQQKNEDDFVQSLSHFYRLRYGTMTTSIIPRTDSLLKRMKWSCSPGTQKRINKADRSSLTQSMTASTKLDPNVIGARTYTIGTGSLRKTMTSVSSDDDCTALTDSLNGDDNDYVSMYRNASDLINHISKMPLPAEDQEDNGDEDTALSPYEVMNMSPQQSVIKEGKTKLTPVSPVKGSKDDSFYLILSPKEKSSVNPNDNNHYLTLTELGADEEKESQEKKEDLSKDNHTTSPTMTGTNNPIAPPRPTETLPSHKQSVSTDTATSSRSSSNGSDRTSRPQSTIVSSPHRTLSSDATPIPPPRPLETMMGRSYTQPNIIPPHENEVDSMTSPKIKNSQTMKSEKSSSLRLPPYSEDYDTSEEHELYYIVPNSLSMS